MKLLTRLMTATVVLIMIAAPNVKSQTSDAPKNEIEVRGVLSIPSGDASFSSSGTSGSVISFSRDFDFRNELGFEFRFTHRTSSGKHKFQAGYSQTTWNRNTTLSRSFTFLGETFVANLDASADLRLSNFHAMYAYRWGNEKFRIGPTGARLFATRNFGFSGGYKFERYRVEKDDDFLRINAHGPFFGGVFRF